ncbi:putative alkaline shock family protein YloU [Kibdelosporangium banguiense]|uniref:Alkaline shock family protein YloU n=1 Tax=Kibdelosporangium banguiense TaxID=1365924 RepID=A0ABS4TS30_9PSEU|nr:Asp23/Gls24 family envelope stress response protein [Kibdelosporangium banguiense]MBP2327202.1 putative alkaline shock family protein YloU [Kibdelosporangium banguiense]
MAPSGQADEDEPLAEAAIETTAEESGEAATDEDLTPQAATEVDDQHGDSAENVEPVPAEAEDTPVTTETDADDVEETEPVTAETRPAAGSRGNVTVGDGVVVKVVTIVAGKIEGVHSLDDGGISVEVDDDVATIKVSLVIEYGHAIKAVAEQIRIGVIEAVEQFLGLDVAAVDVHVSDIQPPAAA